jgi:hypothetical protein
MKVKKVGTRPIGRDVWKALGSTHFKMADDLLWLVGQSLNALGNRYGFREVVEPDESKDEERLRAVQWSRIKAAVRSEREAELDDEAALTPAASELFVLIDTLQNWAKKQANSAVMYEELARDVRRGAPSRRPNALEAILKVHAPKPGGKPGRPKAVSWSDEELIRLVQAAREEGQRTDSAALRTLAAKWLRDEGKYAVGSRLSLLTGNLRRRLAIARRARK